MGGLETVVQAAARVLAVRNRLTLGTEEFAVPEENPHATSHTQNLSNFFQGAAKKKDLTKIFRTVTRFFEP